MAIEFIHGGHDAVLDDRLVNGLYLCVFMTICIAILYVAFVAVGLLSDPAFRREVLMDWGYDLLKVGMMITLGIAGFTFVFFSLPMAFGGPKWGAYVLFILGAVGVIVFITAKIEMLETIQRIQQSMGRH